MNCYILLAPLLCCTAENVALTGDKKEKNVAGLVPLAELVPSTDIKNGYVTVAERRTVTLE